MPVWQQDRGTFIMAARSRPRGGQMKDEYDEERSIWNGIKSEGRNIDQLMVREYLDA